MAEVEEIINVGFSLHQDGKLKEAETAYSEALRLDKNNAEVYNLLGLLKLQQGDPDSAIEYAEAAMERATEAYFFETLFQAYIQKQDFEKLVSKEIFVETLFMNNFSLLFNLAFAFKKLNRNREAIKYYEKALEVNPSSYEGWFNLAHLYSVEAETKNAVSALKICMKLRPNDDETEYFYALALLRIKDYNKGLKHFEKRISRLAAVEIQKKTYPNKAREDNLWKGENIKNKTLLVYYEAGFGDTIMFARYLPLAKKLCKKLIFICQKPLTPLLKENKQLGIDEIIDTFVPETQIDFDVHAPLMSLPYILGLKGDSVFITPDNYITIGKDVHDEYKKKYFDNDRIKIGIKWRGNTYFETERVIPAEKFIPLTKIDNTQFYSFQTFEGSKDISKLDNVIDIGKELVDFSQTAGALSNLDLVICNDTSLAHLAGAMGIPCWVILPYEVNWRWHTDLTKCDWYNNIRLFRQKSINDWDGVFKEVKTEIGKVLAK